MSSADRLRQLRELVGQLELLPQTEERDRVLRQVRARAVDVDTGVTTRQVAARTRAVVVGDLRAMPLDVVDVVDVVDVASVAPSRGRRSLPSRRRWVGEAVATRRSSDVLAADRRLCLEDFDAPDGLSLGPPARGAWTRGLRG